MPSITTAACRLMSRMRLPFLPLPPLGESCCWGSCRRVRGCTDDRQPGGDSHDAYHAVCSVQLALPSVQIIPHSSALNIAINSRDWPAPPSGLLCPGNL